MGSWLFNILMTLRQARDLVVSAGPDTMYRVADSLARLSDSARQVGQFIEQYGPQIQFAPGRQAQAPDAEAQKYIKELQELQQEMEQHAESRESSPEGAQAVGGPMTWFLIARMVAQLIKTLLDNVHPPSPGPTGAAAFAPEGAPAVAESKGFQTGTGAGSPPPPETRKARR